MIAAVAFAWIAAADDAAPAAPAPAPTTISARAEAATDGKHFCEALWLFDAADAAAPQARFLFNAGEVALAAQDRTAAHARFQALLEREPASDLVGTAKARLATIDDEIAQYGVGSSCGAKPAVCGDSVMDAGEQCDDGNTDETDACRMCRAPAAVVTEAAASSVAPESTEPVYAGSRLGAILVGGGIAGVVVGAVLTGGSLVSLVSYQSAAGDIEAARAAYVGADSNVQKKRALDDADEARARMDNARAAWNGGGWLVASIGAVFVLGGVALLGVAIAQAE